MIKKIFLVLTKQMHSLQLLGSEMFSHEGLIVETHFAKLQLLAELYLTSKGKGNKNQWLKDDLPCKFTEEDRLILEDTFSSIKEFTNIVKHWVMAVKDCLLVELGDTANMSQFTFC